MGELINLEEFRRERERRNNEEAARKKRRVDKQDKRPGRPPVAEPDKVEDDPA